MQSLFGKCPNRFGMFFGGASLNLPRFRKSKICHAKTFRIKRVNCIIVAFATNVRKILSCQTFCGKENCLNLNLHTEIGLYGQFLDCQDSFWIVQTVPGLSGQFLDSLWITRTISDFPDIFWVVRTVFRLSGQFLDYPDSF